MTNKDLKYVRDKQIKGKIKVYFGIFFIGELLVGDDGFWRFWPERKGTWEADNLRSIADKLEELNKTWKEDVDDYFEKHQKT